jgi:hypothetical protein
MRFTYELVGVGWARVTIADEGNNAEVVASYLTDALSVLLAAVLEMQQGALSAVASWEQEPGEVRWRFERHDQQVELAVDDWRGTSDGGSGWVTLFATVDTMTSLAQAIASGARSVLDEWGPDGYLEKWAGHPFPASLLHQLESTLR